MLRTAPIRRPVGPAAARGNCAIGLDRSPAMLAELRRRNSALPAVLGDAHGLPFRDRAVDLALFVATLEFLESPEIAIAEASRVTRRGLVLLLLNRWSRGAVSRRRGADSEGAVLQQARDFSLTDARRLARQAVGSRVAAIHWRSALFPRPFEALSAPIPFGDVLGVAVELSE